MIFRFKVNLSDLGIDVVMRHLKGIGCVRVDYQFFKSTVMVFLL